MCADPGELGKEVWRSDNGLLESDPKSRIVHRFAWGEKTLR